MNFKVKVRIELDSPSGCDSNEKVVVEREMSAGRGNLELTLANVINALKDDINVQGFLAGFKQYLNPIFLRKKRE